MVRSLLLGLALTAFVAAADVHAQGPFSCPTTASTNPPQFFAPAPYSVNAPSSDHFWFGTDALWTTLRRDGRWGALHLRDQRMYRNKVFMWRHGYDSRIEQRPALTLTAHRLDAVAPIVQVWEATNAHAKDIGSAMLTAANLPSAGCWQFTAHYGREMLTFVVSVP